jgi:hypothetical protein
MTLGVLFAAGCTDSAQQLPISFGSVQIAEPSEHQTTTNRPLQLWMRVARQALENGHPDTAIRFAQKAVQAFPESDEPLRILAMAYGQKNKNKPPNSVNPVNSGEIRLSSENRKSPNSLAARPAERAKRKPYLLKRRDRTRIASVLYTKRIRSPQPVVPKNGKQGAYRIQLAAYVDLGDAVRGRNFLSRRLPSNFPRLGVFMRHRPAGDDRRVNYRLRSRDLTNRSQAMAYCRTVKAAGFSCLPIRHTSSAWQLVESDTNTRVARAATPSPNIKDWVRLEVRKPVKKPVAITARQSPVKALQSGRTTAPNGPLFRIQLAAYLDLVRAVRGKQILTKSLPDNFPRLVILKKNEDVADDSPINYWFRSQGVWHKRRARALCNEARSAGHACFLVETDSKVWRPVVANR